MAKITLSSQIRHAVQQMPVEQQFLSQLKHVVVKCNPTRPRSCYYKPSSLNCARLMYFDKIQAPITNISEDYSGIRICETGSCSHEKIQYYCTQLKENGCSFEYVDVPTYIKENKLDYLVIKDTKGYETKLFDTRFGISFLCDGILKYTDIYGYTRYYILEIKTETEDKGVFRSGTNPQHINQSVCYSLCLRINDIIWLYEERNRCVPKVFLTTVTQDQRQKLIDLFNYVDNCVDSGVVPNKPENVVCTYCPYKKECAKY